MALALGKVTILIGAGVLGSVLAKEGGTSVSDLVSGAFKIAWRQIRRDDSPPSSTKPRHDSLIAQVKELQNQLKDLAGNRPVIIQNGTKSGLKIYGGPVFGVIVVGIGCMWWKGWKLSDVMFATRRGLSDACSSVGKQLDQVSSSISAAKRHLSLRIDRVDVNLDECAQLTAGTRDEVSELRGDVRVFSVDVESVHRAVQTLETKIGRIEEKQDITTRGVRVLCDFVQTMENSRTASSTAPSIKASPSSLSRPALEHPGVTPTSRTSSLPPKLLSLESSSSTSESPSSTKESPKVKRAFSVSDSGLKVLDGLLEPTLTRASSELPNGTPGADDPKSNESSSSSRWKLPFFRTNSVNVPLK